MSINDVIYKILVCTYKNYDEIFKDNDLKEYVGCMILFIEKHQEFLKLIKSNDPSDIDKLKKLSSELEGIRDKFKYYCKLNRIEYKGDFATISHLLLKHKNSIFVRKNINDINETLNEKLFVPINEYNTIINDFEEKIHSILKENSYTFNSNNKNEYDILKAIFCILRMYELVYDKYGLQGLNRLRKVNDGIYKMKDMYKMNIYSRRTDLYDILYSYNLLFKAKGINDIDSICDMVFDVADKDGIFKKFKELEISELLYKCDVNNKKHLLFSSSNSYAFKDLSVIGNAIKNGEVNGRASSKTIDDFISGKLKLNINEKPSGGSYGTI